MILTVLAAVLIAWLSFLVLRSRRDLRRLTDSLRENTERLQQKFSELDKEKQRFEAILNGMVEGVLVTDAMGKISLVNPALRTILGLSDPCEGRTILECLRNKAIHETIESVLQEGTPQEKEISVTIGLEERHLAVESAPLGGDGKPVGCVTVFYDITRLRSLENMRREFVANVSHELKTPLANIMGYAETLRRGALNDSDAAGRFVEKIENNSHQLKNLVEDILKISEVESGRLEMNPVSCPLKDVIESLHTHFEEALEKKKLVFKASLSKGLSVKADPAALRQIVSNLIDNAIKYTPEGGRITLTAISKETFCEISVQDTGLGIPEKDLSHVFERFYRVDKARSRQVGGTGLGLSIVKHLVQAQGGEVGVESRTGEGSRFFFTIPLS